MIFHVLHVRAQTIPIGYTIIEPATISRCWCGAFFLIDFDLFGTVGMRLSYSHSFVQFQPHGVRCELLSFGFCATDPNRYILAFPAGRCTSTLGQEGVCASWQASASGTCPIYHVSTQEGASLASKAR